MRFTQIEQWTCWIFSHLRAYVRMRINGCFTLVIISFRSADRTIGTWTFNCINYVGYINSFAHTNPLVIQLHIRSHFCTDMITVSTLNRRWNERRVEFQYSPPHTLTVRQNIRRKYQIYKSVCKFSVSNPPPYRCGLRQRILTRWKRGRPGIQQRTSYCRNCNGNIATRQRTDSHESMTKSLSRYSILIQNQRVNKVL